MVIRDTVDSLASSCPPPTPRRLAHGRHRHPAHGAGDLDTDPGPWSDLPVSDAAGPSPRCPQGHGAALGTMARRAAPAGAEVLLRQWPLHPSPLDRAAGPAGCPLGAADAAARAVAGAHRYGASGNGRGVPEPSPGLGVSRHTLLRLRRRLPLPDVATPQVLGVDDWAVRNGRPDGTIVIDLERRRALALRPDRAAKTVALW
jgi:hypothetical protein